MEGRNWKNAIFLSALPDFLRVDIPPSRFRAMGSVRLVQYGGHSWRFSKHSVWAQCRITNLCCTTKQKKKGNELIPMATSFLAKKKKSKFGNICGPE